MNTPENLLARLDEIAASVAASGDGLALLAMGSVGLELNRLDVYSDLDFFVIVRKGMKTRFLEDLSWIESVSPVGYTFKNTPDGHKLLFEDGIFCEYAVFEPAELEKIPFPAGRVVWAANGFDRDLLAPKSVPTPDSPEIDVELKIGEALTNLYVGLLRFHRGEKLSAARFVQWYAVDRVVELLPLIEDPHPAHLDEFDLDRRFEVRFPKSARMITAMQPGYERTLEAAKVILRFLQTHFDVNDRMRREIEALL